MKLLNVRLNEEDFARAQALRKEGVEISGLIRDSIRAEHARRMALRTPARVIEIADAIFRDHPDDENVGPREVDSTNRKAVSKAISANLRRHTRSFWLIPAKAKAPHAPSVV